MKTRFPAWVVILSIIGLLLRIWFSLTSHHVYYPDEIFQSVEQGYRLVYGYGIIPWDVAYGLRSVWFAAFSAIPMYLLSFFHLTTPEIYLPATNIWFSWFSISLIPAVYLLSTYITRRKHEQFLATYAATIWYELVYFAPRALTESVSINLLSLGFILPHIFPNFRWLGPALLMLASTLRPQYAILAIVIAYALYRQRFYTIKQAVGGGLLGMLPLAATDYMTQGIPLGSVINNVRLSFFSGASEVFGTHPLIWYFRTIIGTTGGLFILTFTTFRQGTYRHLSRIIVGLLLLHSVISHKEYRFIYAAIPLILMVASTVLYRFFLKHNASKQRALYLSASLISVLSILGITHNLPGQSAAYQIPPLQRDPYFSLFTHVRNDPTACGLMHDSRNWVYTGGYYSIGKPVPFYDASVVAPPEAYNYLITTTNPPAGYALVATTASHSVLVQGKPLNLPPYTLYKRTGNCQPEINYYRTFEAIEVKMAEIGAVRAPTP
jgi:GPI mannosyltransferase 3